MSDAQVRISQSLRARGYADGYTPQQYAARQAIKTVEELSEALHCLTVSDSTDWKTHDAWLDLLAAMRGAEKIARKLFDTGFAPEVWVADRYAAELADVITPALVAAQELGVDLLGTAIIKAEENVKRGVRPSKEGQ